jgi:hypothetical protein
MTTLGVLEKESIKLCLLAVAEPEVFKWVGKLLTNTLLYRYAL